MTSYDGLIMSLRVSKSLTASIYMTCMPNTDNDSFETTSHDKCMSLHIRKQNMLKAIAERSNVTFRMV